MTHLLVLLALAATPTPGPLQRAGQALDQAAAQVGKTLENALLEVKVRVALLEHLKQDALRVGVKVSASTVLLEGVVRTRASQALAEEVARSVPGVERVVNRLRVEEVPSGSPVARAVGRVEQEVADALLEAKIKAHLLEVMGLAAFQVEVEATDGVVSLSGRVQESEQRRLAEKTAQAVPGVVEVHNLLRVAK
ncbi:MAG: BON domain-containing protein [Thermoanaerobaculum sp.]|nr:BON domain-containing protein [Thermoanaerobaculum sp.]